MEGSSSKGSRYQPISVTDGDNHTAGIRPYSGVSPTRNNGTGGASSYDPTDTVTTSAISYTQGSLPHTSQQQQSSHGSGQHRYTRSSSTLGSLTQTASLNRDDCHITGSHDDDNDDDNDTDTEINSLVDDLRSPAVTATSAFRKSSSPWTDQPLEINIHTNDAAISAGSPLTNNNGTSVASPLHLSRAASRDSASLGPHWDVDEHDDFDDDDDDEVNLRRYQLDFTLARDVPLPAEFRGHTVLDRISFTVKQYSTLAMRNWQGLRQAARQRRAARLLTMPSESVRYKLHACCISLCCDATDMGIACTAVCLILWIAVGLLVTGSGGGTSNEGQRSHVHTYYYWLTGAILFVIRVTARRSFEAAMAYMAGRRRQRQQHRQQQQYHRQRGRLGSRQRLASIEDDTHHIGTVVSAAPIAGSPPTDMEELPVHRLSTT